MESLDEKIVKFLDIPNEDLYSQYENGNGDGYGKGFGYGKAIGSGSLSGIVLCDSGNDGSNLLGINTIGGKHTYSIDSIPTIIENIKGNIAKGYIVQADLSLKPCYIAKVGNVFAHGESVKEAYQDALNKAIQSECVECTPDYINYVISKYPDLDTEVDNRELFDLHNIITGSCNMGRNEFIEEHNIDLNGKTSMRDFLNLVKYSYGSERIQKIIESYDTIIK